MSCRRPFFKGLKRCSTSRLLCAYLERDGLRAHTAADGREALRLMQQLRPDLVLLERHPRLRAAPAAGAGDGGPCCANADAPGQRRAPIRVAAIARPGPRATCSTRPAAPSRPLTLTEFRLLSAWRPSPGAARWRLEARAMRWRQLGWRRAWPTCRPHAPDHLHGGQACRWAARGCTGGHALRRWSDAGRQAARRCRRVAMRRPAPSPRCGAGGGAPASIGASGAFLPPPGPAAGARRAEAGRSCWRKRPFTPPLGRQAWAQREGLPATASRAAHLVGPFRAERGRASTGGHLSLDRGLRQTWGGGTRWVDPLRAHCRRAVRNNACRPHAVPHWSVMTHGAYDFAADARGYSWGLALEWYHDDWALRAGRSAPSQPATLDPRSLRHDDRGGAGAPAGLRNRAPLHAARSRRRCAPASRPRGLG